MTINQDWNSIRSIFQDIQKTGGSCAFATVNEDGSPHITPIGSLVLLDNCLGIFWEKFPRTMRHNMEQDKRVCIMAVNARPLYWITSLIKGKFTTPPAVRLLGTAGERRKATEREAEIWQKRIHRFKWSKGYDLLWSDMSMVREIRFHAFEPVRAGAMSGNLHP